MSSARVDAVQQRVDEVRRRLSSLQTTVTATAVLGGNAGEGDSCSSFPVASSSTHGSALPSMPSAHLLTLREKQQAQGQSLFETVPATSTFDAVRARLGALRNQGNTVMINAAAAATASTANQDGKNRPAISADNNNNNSEGEVLSTFQSIQGRIAAIATRLHDVSTSAMVGAKENDEPLPTPPSSSAYASAASSRMQQQQQAKSKTATTPFGRREKSQEGANSIISSGTLVKGMFTPRTGFGHNYGSTPNNNSNNHPPRSSSASATAVALSTQRPTSFAGGPQPTRNDPAAKTPLKFAAADGFLLHGGASASDATAAAAAPQPVLVSGAELFAILRLRGVISTHGSSGEHTLPPTPVHKVLLTANEVSQLASLRKALSLEGQEEGARHRAQMQQAGSGRSFPPPKQQQPVATQQQQQQEVLVVKANSSFGRPSSGFGPSMDRSGAAGGGAVRWG